jgi:hypothetical protein
MDPTGPALDQMHAPGPLFTMTAHVPIPHVSPAVVVASPTWYEILALIFAGAVMLYGLIQGGHWLLTRGARAEERKEAKEAAAKVAGIETKVEELSTSVASALEAMAGRAPKVELSFVVAGEPSERLVVNVPAIPEIDIEAVIRSAREASLETYERAVATQTPRRAAWRDTVNQKIAGAISPLVDAARVAGFETGQRYMPITEEDRASSSTRSTRTRRSSERSCPTFADTSRTPGSSRRSRFVRATTAASLPRRRTSRSTSRTRSSGPSSPSGRRFPEDRSSSSG